MFKSVREMSNVVSLLAYCPVDKTYLLMAEPSSELWIPSFKVVKNSWKETANVIIRDIFGIDNTSYNLLRMYKIWIPDHHQPCLYHVIYKLNVTSEQKKKSKSPAKMYHGLLRWSNEIELERLNIHDRLRSPELLHYVRITSGDRPMDTESIADNSDIGSNWDAEVSANQIVEVCENHVILTEGCGAYKELLNAAKFSISDQHILYREYLLSIFPAYYMNLQMFVNFLLEIGWARTQCQNIFRSADIYGRGGLTFRDFLFCLAALDPSTHHGGVAAEIRCGYIFRFFDKNRDSKIEYSEFKEMIAAMRLVKGLPTDAVNVSKDADICAKQIGIHPNCQLGILDFLKAVGDLRLRGTSAILRSPKCVIVYLRDLQQREKDAIQFENARVLLSNTTEEQNTNIIAERPSMPTVSQGMTAMTARSSVETKNYAMATHAVRVTNAGKKYYMEKMSSLGIECVSESSARIISSRGVASMEALSEHGMPHEALSAVRFYGMQITNADAARIGGNVHPKDAFSWGSQGTGVLTSSGFGNLLLKLAEQVKPLLHSEPRLVRLNSPVYVIGDLHGNLNDLLWLDRSLWSGNPAVKAGNALFLGDYVDRGLFGAEVIAYLFASKVQSPGGVTLLRGNHEIRDVQKMFTFYNECLNKFGENLGSQIWNAINNAFDVMPLAAVVDDKVFCCHGGIPPPWICPVISAIDTVPIPLVNPVQQSALAWELMWNDPVKSQRITQTTALELAANEGFAMNARRGTGHIFDQAALDRFLRTNSLSHVVRAHEMQPSGFLCQYRGKLVTVFSSSHYCGSSNDAAVLLLDKYKVRVLRIDTSV